MSKSRVIVLSVVHQGLSKAEAARRYGVSWQWVHTLVTRYHEGGIEAVDARSSRPRSNPRQIDETLAQEIVDLRRSLTSEGLDAGPLTIAWHLEQRGLRVPSTSSIRRVLVGAGLVEPEPKKRPRASLRRFSADQPNETWQSDFTHWRLSDDHDVEIIDWLDDHSRYLLHLRVHARVTGPIVIESFTDCVNEFGLPTSTLTDNGVVYTTRLIGARNGLENLLATLGVTQKNGHPHHPQTQGKIERFHQTLKKWLAQQPTADTLTELQHQLDLFRDLYNERRPHRALERATPGVAYRATPKAVAGSPLLRQYRVRFDTVDQFGKVTLRHGGILHHLGIGNTHRGMRILLLIDEESVTVTDLDTGEVLSEHDIDDERNYWRNRLREPGRWPG
jgi:transposase InsO family protein